MNRRKAFIVHLSSFIVLLGACAQPEPAPHEIRRVVSLAPNVTEMIYAAGCGAKIAGTDNFSDYPDAVKRLPKVGGVEPDVERNWPWRAVAKIVELEFGVHSEPFVVLPALWQ